MSGTNMEQEADRQLRMFALEKALQATTNKHSLMPDEMPVKVLATARKFEAFLRGEEAPR